MTAPGWRYCRTPDTAVPQFTNYRLSNVSRRLSRLIAAGRVFIALSQLDLFQDNALLCSAMQLVCVQHRAALRNGISAAAWCRDPAETWKPLFLGNYHHIIFFYLKKLISDLMGFGHGLYITHFLDQSMKCHQILTKASLSHIMYHRYWWLEPAAVVFSCSGPAQHRMNHGVRSAVACPAPHVETNQPTIQPTGLWLEGREESHCWERGVRLRGGARPRNNGESGEGGYIGTTPQPAPPSRCPPRQSDHRKHDSFNEFWHNKRFVFPHLKIEIL